MSTLLNHYDELLERADRTVDDEYQAQVMHRANTLSTFFTVYLSYACSLILAWCLPGNYTLFFCRTCDGSILGVHGIIPVDEAPRPSPTPMEFESPRNRDCFRVRLPLAPRRELPQP